MSQSLEIEQVLDQLTDQADVEPLVFSLFEKLSPDEIQRTADEMNSKLSQKNQEVKILLSKNHEHLFISAELIEKLHRFLEVSKENLRKIVRMSSDIEKGVGEEEEKEDLEKVKKGFKLSLDLNIKGVLNGVLTKLEKESQTKIRIAVSAVVASWILRTDPENEEILERSKFIFLEEGSLVWENLVKGLKGEFSFGDEERKNCIGNVLFFLFVFQKEFVKKNICSEWDLLDIVGDEYCELLLDYLEFLEEDEGIKNEDGNVGLIFFLKKFVKGILEENKRIDLVFLAELILELEKGSLWEIEGLNSVDDAKTVILRLFVENLTEINSNEKKINLKRVGNKTGQNSELDFLKFEIITPELDSLILTYLKLDSSLDSSSETQELKKHFSLIKALLNQKELLNQFETSLNVEPGSIIFKFEHGYQNYCENLAKKIQNKINFKEDVKEISLIKETEQKVSLLLEKDLAAKELLIKLEKLISIDPGHLQTQLSTEKIFSELRRTILTQLGSLELKKQDSLMINLEKLILALYYEHASKFVSYLSSKTGTEDFSSPETFKRSRSSNLKEIIEQSSLQEVLEFAEKIFSQQKLTKNQILKKIFFKELNKHISSKEIEFKELFDYLLEDGQKAPRIYLELRNDFPMLIDYHLNPSEVLELDRNNEGKEVKCEKLLPEQDLVLSWY